MMSEEQKTPTRCTADAPCPDAKGIPGTMLGPAYRKAAHPEHGEFAPTYVEQEARWDDHYIDGLEKSKREGYVMVAKVYRKSLGVDADGLETFFVGDYVGNRRKVMDNDANPDDMGSTWSIYLQEDPELGTPVRCYRLNELEAIYGSRSVKIDDYKPKRGTLYMYYQDKVPPKPKLGTPVTHPQYGGGVVVRVTGTGQCWYANTVFGWDDDVTPAPGISVRRAMPAPNNEFYYAYGDVVDVTDEGIEVEYENGKTAVFSSEHFYKEFRLCTESGSANFHELFNLDGGDKILTPVFRNLTKDVRTADERIMGLDSRSGVAFSALIAANTPDSGHFVPRTKEGPWKFNPDSDFRFHHERAAPPKNEDFAPLVGRPKKVARPKKGWSYDRLNAVQERLAQQSGEAREAPHEPRRLPGSIWDNLDVEVEAEDDGDKEPVHVPDFNGSIIRF